MEFNRVEVGRRIAKRRKELNIKQNVLAKKLGYHKNHLSGIEHGRIAPSMDLFVGICKELDVSPNYLLSGAMHPENIPLDIAADIAKCKGEDIEVIAEIVKIYVEKANKDVTSRPK